MNFWYDLITIHNVREVYTYGIDCDLFPFPNVLYKPHVLRDGLCAT